METKEEKQQHPLAYWTPKCIEDWPQWLEHFQEAKFAEDRYSLLYHGLRVQAHGEPYFERIKFYLSLAEDQDKSEISGPYDPPDWRDQRYETVFGKKRIAELRAVIARKAFEELCLKLFRDTEKRDDYDSPFWAGWVRDEFTLQKLLHFFRPRLDDERFFVNLRYYNHDHVDKHTQIAVNFILDVIRRTWIQFGRRAPECWGFGEKSPKQFKKYYPAYVSVLNCLRRLDLLHVRNVNAACRTKLRELAIGKAKLSKEETKEAIKKAYAEGSSAAEVLILLEIRRKAKAKKLLNQRLEEQGAMLEAKRAKLK